MLAARAALVAFFLYRMALSLVPLRPATMRTPCRSSSAMTHSRDGRGRMFCRHALVRALARWHFSSASAVEKVPRAMVLPAHWWTEQRRVYMYRNRIIVSFHVTYHIFIHKAMVRQNR